MVKVVGKNIQYVSGPVCAFFGSTCETHRRKNTEGRAGDPSTNEGFVQNEVLLLFTQYSTNLITPGSRRKIRVRREQRPRSDGSW